MRSELLVRMLDVGSLARYVPLRRATGSGSSGDENIYLYFTPPPSPNRLKYSSPCNKLEPFSLALDQHDHNDHSRLNCLTGLPQP